MVWLVMDGHDWAGLRIRRLTRRILTLNQHAAPHDRSQDAHRQAS
jgi:hypothetical protein